MQKVKSKMYGIMQKDQTGKYTILIRALNYIGIKRNQEMDNGIWDINVMQNIVTYIKIIWMVRYQKKSFCVNIAILIIIVQNCQAITEATDLNNNILIWKKI